MKHQILHSCLLSAPTPKQMTDATEHLRYWPYVKAYRKLDEKNVEAVMFVGSFPTHVQQNFVLTHSRRIILLCLRRYGIKMGRWYEEKEFTPNYSADLFLRPDEKLKPLASFIQEVEQNSTYL